MYNLTQKKKVKKELFTCRNEIIVMTGKNVTYMYISVQGWATGTNIEFHQEINDLYLKV